MWWLREHKITSSVPHTELDHVKYWGFLTCMPASASAGVRSSMVRVYFLSYKCISLLWVITMTIHSNQTNVSPFVDSVLPMILNFRNTCIRSEFRETNFSLLLGTNCWLHLAVLKSIIDNIGDELLRRQRNKSNSVSKQFMSTLWYCESKHRNRLFADHVERWTYH